RERLSMSTKCRIGVTHGTASLPGRTVQKGQEWMWTGHREHTAAPAPLVLAPRGVALLALHRGRSALRYGRVHRGRTFEGLSLQRLLPRHPLRLHLITSSLPGSPACSVAPCRSRRGWYRYTHPVPFRHDR